MSHKILVLKIVSTVEPDVSEPDVDEFMRIAAALETCLLALGNGYGGGDLFTLVVSAGESSEMEVGWMTFSCKGR